MRNIKTDLFWVCIILSMTCCSTMNDNLLNRTKHYMQNVEKGTKIDAIERDLEYLKREEVRGPTEDELCNETLWYFLYRIENKNVLLLYAKHNRTDDRPITQINSSQFEYMGDFYIGSEGPVSREKMRRNMEKIETGTTLNEIEKKLNLPKPYKLRGPAPIDPVWRFYYNLGYGNFLMIIAHVKEGRGYPKHGINTENFKYGGKYTVGFKMNPHRYSEEEGSKNKQ